MISEKHIKAWGKFNDELNAYRKDYGDDFAWLYEDAFTTRQVRNFQMTPTGVLTWEETDYRGKTSLEREIMMDEDDAKGWLKFWRDAFRLAKKYNEMPAEVLDAIQDGEKEDIA